MLWFPLTNIIGERAYIKGHDRRAGHGPVLPEPMCYIRAPELELVYLTERQIEFCKASTQNPGRPFPVQVLFPGGSVVRWPLKDSNPWP